MGSVSGGVGGCPALAESTSLTESVREGSTECSHGACADGAEYEGQATFHPEVTQGRGKYQASTRVHHQMVNTEIRLIIFFAAKDGEALYSQQKQDWELTVLQIMNSLLPNADLS